MARYIKLRRVGVFIKMNSRGQTLVIFVIILPIILFVLAFIIDIGLMHIEKRSISNNTYDALKYYLSNIGDSDVEINTRKLLEENIKNSTVTILDTDSKVTIKVEKDYKSLYSSIVNNTHISVVYDGIKEDNKVIKG